MDYHANPIVRRERVPEPGRLSLMDFACLAFIALVLAMYAWALAEAVVSTL